MHALQVTAATPGLLCAGCPAAVNVLMLLPGALDTLGGLNPARERAAAHTGGMRVASR